MFFFPLPDTGLSMLVVAVNPSLFPVGPHQRLPECPHNKAMDFPQNRQFERRQSRSENVFCDLNLGITHHPFHHILSVRSESLSPAHIRGVGN